LVVDDVFDRLVEQAACWDLIDSTYRIDSTHVTAIQYNDEATWNYDSTAEEHYYGFGCVIVSAGPKIPIAAEFTQRKQIDAPIWMLGDSGYDILEWHDFLLAQGVVPIAPYTGSRVLQESCLSFRLRVRVCQSCSRLSVWRYRSLQQHLHRLGLAHR